MARKRIIEARVRQKTDTLEVWMNNDLPLLDGEQAFIRSDVDGEVIGFKLASEGKKFSELPYPDFTTRGKVSPTSSFVGRQSGVYIPTTTGTYNGVPVNLTEGYQVLYWDGSTLEKVVYPAEYNTAVFGGVIDSTKDLSTPPVVSTWYIASAGTYNTVPETILTETSILSWDGSTWSHIPFELEIRGEFLVADNVQEVRNITPQVAQLLVNGTYKGVQLLGYYTKGDTPAPIEYYLSDTEEEDDGGSVIEVSGIKLEHEFKNKIDLRYYGIVEGEDSTAVMSLLVSAMRRFGIKVLDIDIDLSLYETLNISNIDRLRINISKSIIFTPYRGVNFTSCSDLRVIGEINGMGQSTVGFTFTNCPRVNVSNLKVVDFGNPSLNQVRGLEFVGDCSNSIVDKCEFRNIISSAVSAGVVFAPSSDGLDWSKNCKIINSNFINIQPRADADAIKTLLIGKEANLLVDNCYFEDCAKRAFKSQSRGDVISNCTINGDSVYPIDFQDGHGKAFNIKGHITGTWEALISILNYNVEISNIDFTTDISYEDMSSTCRGIDITKITTTDGLNNGYFKLSNISIDKFSDSRIRNISNSILEINNMSVGRNKSNYLFNLNNQSVSLLKITNSSLEIPNASFFGVIGASTNVDNVFIKDNLFNRSFFGGRNAGLRDKDIAYLDNERTDYAQILNYSQKGTQRIYYGVSQAPTPSIAMFLDSRVGDIAYHRNPQNSNIDKYICIASGNGTDSAGTWKPFYISDLATPTTKGLVNQAVAVPNGSSVDTLLQALRNAGILAT